MGTLGHLFYPWSLILQVLAIFHFIRRRPDTYWLYIILFLGPIGALVYLFAEALPDVQLLGHSFKKISRGKRIKALEIAIRDNPSPGNFEELGELYMEDGKFQLARDAFSRAVSARTYSLDTLYHRAICAIQLGDAQAAVPDLEQVIAKDPTHDFNRGPGQLAHAYALVGQKKRAEALFRKVTLASTLSETYLNFADMLASEGRNAEAREWAQKVLDKRPTMPHYLRRRERPWFRRARKILNKVPA
jgi:hypothetical protein